MAVVYVDPLTLLGVTTSVARAAGVSRRRDEPQKQHRSLTTTLASGERSTALSQRHATGTEQAVGTSRIAVMLDISRHKVLAARRPILAGLAEALDQWCVIGTPVPPFVPGGPRDG